LRDGGLDHFAERRIDLGLEVGLDLVDLSELGKGPSSMCAEIVHAGYLRSLMWHNLPKADVLYKLVLGINLFAMIGEAKTALLLKAVEYRHDCVHRNGYDKDGNRLQVFGLEYVAEVGDAVHEMVEGVQKMLFPRGQN
jgi:hypothetical protein